MDSIREKGIHPIEYEFATKMGNFLIRIMRNLYARKVMDYLVDEVNLSAEKIVVLAPIASKSEFFAETIRLGLPMPFQLD